MTRSTPWRLTILQLRHILLTDAWTLIRSSPDKTLLLGAENNPRT